MRQALLAATLAIVVAHHAHARPLNSFIGSQNLGAGATVSVGGGAASIDGQAIINFTTGDFPLSGEPVSFGLCVWGDRDYPTVFLRQCDRPHSSLFRTGRRLGRRAILDNSSYRGKHRFRRG
jgi:hypothetical protein